jgi:hypothetical protein
MMEAIMIVTTTANCSINSLNTISELFAFTTSCWKPVILVFSAVLTADTEFFPYHVSGLFFNPRKTHHAIILGLKQRTENVDIKVTL